MSCKTGVGRDEVIFSNSFTSCNKDLEHRCCPKYMSEVLSNNTSVYSAMTCVIGGAGFIGREVVLQLLARQRQVVVIGRRAQPVMPLPAQVRYIANPDHNEELLLDVLKQCDEVIDLGYSAMPQTSFQDPVRDILVNVPATVRLFELAADCNLRKFVWISSGGAVYGHSNHPMQNELHPNFPISPYGITKLTLEKYARLFYDSKGLPIVCVRPSNAFGEGQRTNSGQGFIAVAIAAVLDGRELSLFGEHGTIRDYLHVQDMARGIVAALEQGSSGEIYNLGSGHGLSNLQVLDALRPLVAASGYELRVDILPPRPFDVPLSVLDSRKLSEHTGWQPRQKFRQALQQTWDWYISQRHL
jgi:UDP-glucose 4-epimerase